MFGQLKLGGVKLAGPPTVPDKSNGVIPSEWSRSWNPWVGLCMPAFTADGRAVQLRRLSIRINLNNACPTSGPGFPNHKIFTPRPSLFGPEQGIRESCLPNPNKIGFSPCGELKLKLEFPQSYLSHHVTREGTRSTHPHPLNPPPVQDGRPSRRSPTGFTSSGSSC